MTQFSGKKKWKQPSQYKIISLMNPLYFVNSFGVWRKWCEIRMRNTDKRHEPLCTRRYKSRPLVYVGLHVNVVSFLFASPYAFCIYWVSHHECAGPRPTTGLLLIILKYPARHWVQTAQSKIVILPFDAYSYSFSQCCCILKKKKQT